jgi:hypothetical protein
MSSSRRHMSKSGAAVVECPLRILRESGGRNRDDPDPGAFESETGFCSGVTSGVSAGRAMITKASPPRYRLVRDGHLRDSSVLLITGGRHAHRLAPDSPRGSVSPSSVSRAAMFRSLTDRQIHTPHPPGGRQSDASVHSTCTLILTVSPGNHCTFLPSCISLAGRPRVSHPHGDGANHTASLVSADGRRTYGQGWHLDLSARSRLNFSRGQRI